MKTILITGCSGFIGYHLTKKLQNNYNIIGIDNLNEYYDINLKKDRLNNLKHKNFKFIKCDISNKEELDKIFSEYKIDKVINLAAQAGVRYSIENPDVYINTNIIGFYNILECLRKYKINHLIYASSSSVYGNNELPFKESNSTDNQISLYAAIKRPNFGNTITISDAVVDSIKNIAKYKNINKIAKEEKQEIKEYTLDNYMNKNIETVKQLQQKK